MSWNIVTHFQNCSFKTSHKPMQEPLLPKPITEWKNPLRVCSEGGKATPGISTGLKVTKKMSTWLEASTWYCEERTKSPYFIFLRYQGLQVYLLQKQLFYSLANFSSVFSQHHLKRVVPSLQCLINYRLPLQLFKFSLFQCQDLHWSAHGTFWGIETFIL